MFTIIRSGLCAVTVKICVIVCGYRVIRNKAYTECSPPVGAICC